MNLKTFLTDLFKEDTPDEEQCAEAQGAPAQTSRNSQDSEKLRRDAKIIAQNGTSADQIDADQDDEDEEYDDAPNAGLVDQPETPTRGPRRMLSRVFSYIFPSPSNEEEIQAYIPHYRTLPILSGIAIPFCILLEIPGLTEPWYISINGGTIVASKPNPPFYDIGIALSILCGALANIFLVVRFLEKRIKTMTILCILFLSIHDILNVAALAIFGATANGFTYGQAFWMTLSSTIVSTFTNVTLIIDFVLTSDFKRSGSGLTRRQRSLVIIIIGLFCYLAVGALVNALLLDLTFINGLYFTVVTIETIGFGDIVPNSPRSRVFICFYATLGVVNIAFVVGYIRETLLEGLDFKYRKRLLAIQERRRVALRRRRAENRWRHAIVWRLRQRHAPIWVPKNVNNRQSLWSKVKSYFWLVQRGVLSTRSTHETRHHGMKLNLWALPPCQLEAAALEAGVPLDTLLPPDFQGTYNPEACQHDAGIDHHTFPAWFAVHPVYQHDNHIIEPLTHRRLGAMAAMVTKLSLTIYESGGTPLPHGPLVQNGSGTDIHDSSGSLQTSSEDVRDYRADVADTERKAYTRRSGLSWGWFFIFWLGGAGIFKATEDWTFGSAVYFCFISFSTIGYGDLTPTTPAGRCIFVVWALIGVATMTIFISVVADAYTYRYKGILGRNSFKHVIQQYRQRTKVELNEKVERISMSTSTKVILRNRFEHAQQADTVDDTSPRTSGAGTDVVEDDEEDGPDLPAVAGPGPTSVAIASMSRPESRLDDTHIRQLQRSLEQLPRRILTETRSIQQYMQLAGDAGTVKGVHTTIGTLVDEVMDGRKLPEPAKVDILRDDEARQTLMMLGIERSLKELVSVAEQAVAAIQERDQLVSTLEGGKAVDELDRGPLR